MPEGTTTATEIPKERERTTSQGVGRLIGQYGSAEAALGVLLGENASYRQRHRNDQTRIAELEGKQPKDGTVVLSADDVKTWEAFRAFKLTPEQITGKLKENETLSAKVVATERRITFEDAAKELGMNPTILADLLQTKGLHVEMRETDVEGTDGKPTKKRVPYTRAAADEKATLEPLNTLIERDLAGYLPALKAESGTTTASSSSSSTTTSSGNGTRFPRQGDGTRIPPVEGRTLDDTYKEKAATGLYAL